MSETVSEGVLHFCVAAFYQKHCFAGECAPEPEFDLIPIKQGNRTWNFIKLTPFHRAITQPLWIAHIYGQRSDGRFFQAMASLPDPCKCAEGDGIETVTGKLEEAMELLNTFRDCSCGIIGYRETGDVDEDGFPISVAITSPCVIHGPDGVSE